VFVWGQATDGDTSAHSSTRKIAFLDQKRWFIAVLLEKVEQGYHGDGGDTRPQLPPNPGAVRTM
jgi:hypothetical protein